MSHLDFFSHLLRVTDTQLLSESETWTRASKMSSIWQYFTLQHPTSKTARRNSMQGWKLAKFPFRGNGKCLGSSIYYQTGNMLDTQPRDMIMEYVALSFLVLQRYHWHLKHLNWNSMLVSSCFKLLDMNLMRAQRLNRISKGVRLENRNKPNDSKNPSRAEQKEIRLLSHRESLW